jgi:Ca2+-binding RTX toxin-like protein
LHALEVHYFEATGNQVLQLKWSGPDTGNVMEIVDGASFINYGEAVNIKPDAVEDFSVIEEDAAVNIDVLANDHDHDGDDLEVTAVTQGSHGVVVINANGTLGYTSNTNYTGPDSFSYTVSDGNGGTSTATVNVTVYAATQDDIFTATSGNDSFDGGSGNDTVTYADATAAVSIDLNLTTAQSTGGSGSDTLLNIENIIGSVHRDSLRGNALANHLQGGDNMDTLYGNGGNDFLDGGDGKDRANYASASAAVTVDLSAGTASDGLGGTDILISIEDILGSGYGDTFIGNDANNAFNGERGNDTFIGGLGNDNFNGGFDIDTVSYETSTGGVTVNLETGTGNDGMGGSELFSSVENIKGSFYNDTIRGNIGNNTLWGGGGSDILYATGGSDTLYGEDGADTFAFTTGDTTADVIADFNTAQGDKIDLSDLLQGYDPLTDIITEFVEFTANGADSVIKVDADGGANNFVQIAILNNVTGLTDEEALVASGTLVAA